MDFTKQEITSIIIISGSSISLCGCLYIIFSIMLCKRLRHHTVFRYVFFLCLNDLCISLWGLAQLFVQIQDDNLSCQLLGFLEVFLRLSSIFWAKVFCDSMYDMVVLDIAQTQKCFKLIATIIILPAIMSSIPFLLGYYGAADITCSFRDSLNSDENFLMNAAVYYVPFTLVMIHNIDIVREVVKVLRENTVEAEAEGLYGLLRYPLVLLPYFFLSLADKIVESLDHRVMTLKYATLFVFMIQGLINALVYGWNSAVRGEMKELVEKWSVNKQAQMEVTFPEDAGEIFLKWKKRSSRLDDSYSLS